MKAVLFYGVRLPIQHRENGEVETDYSYIFSENFIGSSWELHVRQSSKRHSAYLCLTRLTAHYSGSDPFRMINPRGVQDVKMKPADRDELKDILKSFGVDYVPPKWFLACSE